MLVIKISRGTFINCTLAQLMLYALYIQLHFFFLSKYGTTNITNKAHPIANKEPKFSNSFTPYFVYNINTIILQKYF